MSTVVFGVFDDAHAADRAAQTAHDDLAVDGVVHSGHLREEEVQIGGSEALQGAIQGGLVVGLAGALVATFVIWPYAGFNFGLSGFLIMALAGSVFGVVAGAVAGASECKSAIRKTAADVERGKTLVTFEASDREEVLKLRDSLTASGATNVQAA
jgi:hypothetical protein